MQNDADATTRNKRKAQLPNPQNREQRDLLHEFEEDYLAMEAWARNGFVSGYEVLGA